MLAFEINIPDHSLVYFLMDNKRIKEELNKRLRLTSERGGGREESI